MPPRLRKWNRPRRNQPEVNVWRRRREAAVHGVHIGDENLQRVCRAARRRCGSKHPDTDADDNQEGHDEHGYGMTDRAHHAARNEYRVVLATMPFPANPMETKTGLLRPGTFTLRTRMEYAGEVAGHAVRPWRSRQ